MVKQLAIITWDAASAQLYASQVRDFFGGQVNTRCYSTQLQPDPVIEPADVYLVSTCAFADRDIGQLLPTGGPVRRSRPMCRWPSPPASGASCRTGRPR